MYLGGVNQKLLILKGKSKISGINNKNQRNKFIIFLIDQIKYLLTNLIKKCLILIKSYNNILHFINDI